MTKTLLTAMIMTAITKCRIQLKGLFGNNSVITDVRICKKEVHKQGHFFIFLYMLF